MKSSFWRHCRRLRLEALEDRTVPSGTPHMVLDINTTTPTSNSRDIVAVGSMAYFAANDGHAIGLWKSDRTAAGTTLVKDIWPGPDDYYSSSGGIQPIRYLTNVNGTVFFSGNDGTNGWELWKSDGTTVGTVLVKDISAGSSYPSNLTNVNGTLFFSADDGVHGREMWKSDGTAAGTVMVKDINPGNGYSISMGFTNINGTLYFMANDGVHGRELWKTNGTAAGTVMVKDINPGSFGSSPGNLINVDGTLFFAAYEDAHGRELWKSDGTAAGTVLVKDIRPGGNGLGSLNGYNGNGLTTVNGTLYFMADDGVHGRELWKSNGTAAGTTLVKDVRPGSANSSPYYLTNVNGTVYFAAYDGPGEGLWKSDGTTAGTTLVKEIYTGFIGDGLHILSLTELNGALFFAANDQPNYGHGFELWKSDGTPAGTVVVKYINPFGASSNPADLTVLNGALFFAADDDVHGREVWKSDGTEAGTVIVKDVNSTPQSSNPQSFTNLNGTLFFSAYDGIRYFGLWKTDGTVAGTTAVPFLGNFTNVNGTLFLVGYDSYDGWELWKSDGTTAGTVLIKDIFPGTGGSYYNGYYPNSSTPANLTNVNGTLFFTADDGVHGQELWKSDGTAAGTVLIKDIAPTNFTAGPGPSSLTNVNGTLFFTADDGVHGPELWKSDGTAAGTVMVKDINPGNVGSNVGGAYGDNFTSVNGTLYFSANDGTHGQELWKSDGTAAGTMMVADIRSGSADSKPAHLTNINGTLYFTANDGNGVGLWKSDGTAAGTTLLKDIYNGSAGYSYRLALDNLTNVNGMLFFAANDVTHGKELWKSDGAAANTVMIRDINPGSASSLASSLTNVNGALLFSANDGIHGQELWQSDGTAVGTVMVADINPGSTDSSPGGLTNVNGTLYVSADDGAHGRELWVLPPAPPTVAGVQVNDGSSQRSEVKSITVTFSGPVSFAGNAAAAFQLTHLTDGVAVGLAAAVSSDGVGDTIVTLTFSGSETDPVSAFNGSIASLADGRYALTIFSSQVSANGQALAGGGPNGNYVSPADTYLGIGLHLYRIFGDVSGDGVVDAIDLGLLRQTFNRNRTDPNYLWYLDADGSGAIDASDLGQFRARFNLNVF